MLTQVFEGERVLVVTRAVPGDSVAVVFGFGNEDVELDIELAAGTWEVLLDSHAAARGAEPVTATEPTHRLTIPAASTLVLGAEPIA